MNNEKKSRFSPPAVGGISLLVAFAVLCLTIFALLSLTTVQADVRLADASAQAVADYYAADCAAQEILAQLRNGQFPAQAAVTSHTSDSWHTGVRYTYAVPISDTRELQVEVILGGAADTDYVVTRWQAVSTEEWVYDESLDLWDGPVF